MRLDNIETLVTAARATARQVKGVLDNIYSELETSGATRLLSGIDICNSQVALALVGVFSVYDSRLQVVVGGEKPIDELIKRLASAGHAVDAAAMDDYRLAVNVLKHGVGSSHTKLLARKSHLPFQVQAFVGELAVEGDVCPPSDLVIVTTEHLEQCCDLIETTWAFVQATTPEAV
jgi:hypothetical protein